MSEKEKTTGIFSKINQALPFSRLLLKAGDKVPFLKKIAPYANLAVPVLLLILILLIAIPSATSSRRNNPEGTAKVKVNKAKDGITGNSYTNQLFGTIEFRKDGKFYTDSSLIDIEWGVYALDLQNPNGPSVTLHGKSITGLDSACVLRINNQGQSLSYYRLESEVAEFTRK